MAIPSYKLRYSKKAKHLQIRLSSAGLEVVIPEKRLFSQEYIQSFLRQKESWIAKHLTQLQYKREVTDILPQRIRLEALSQEWDVRYIPIKDKKVKLTVQANQQIVISGDTTNVPQCLRLLRKWLMNIAIEVLPKQLDQVSQETGLSFQDVTVRYNATRWGSCTHQKNINLCSKLLLLSESLMRHVLLHELCHTEYMNHGTSFWKLLMSLDTDAKANAKRLKIAARTLPAWTIKRYNPA